MKIKKTLPLALQAIQCDSIDTHTFYLEARIYNELNRKDHWSKKSKRAREQRSMASNAMMLARVPKLPVSVLLIRSGPHEMDTDGLVASFKHIRDGIADAYGIDDSNPSIIKFDEPLQVKSKVYGVGVTIERMR